MFEVALVAFTTLFATIGPLDVAVTYAGLTATHTPSQRRMMAIKGVAIASGILLLFAIFGNSILVLFGISLPALRIAGGILLLIIAMELVFAKQSAPASATPEDAADAATKNDFSVFPLATPLIAGPGAIGATILLVTDAEGDPMQTTAMFAGLVVVMLLTLATLLLASQIQRALGRTGTSVVSRVVGVLVTALAVEFILTGISQSGLLS